jgi:hypothetical protein
MGRHKSVGLTDNEFDVLKAIEEYYFENFQPPTLREIVLRTDVTSTSLATYIVNSLEEKGMIRIIKRKPVPNFIIGLLCEFR